MRISDWSSDVCSSDLGGQPKTADARRPPVSVWFRPDCRWPPENAPLAAPVPDRDWPGANDSRRPAQPTRAQPFQPTPGKLPAAATTTDAGGAGARSWLALGDLAKLAVKI